MNALNKFDQIRKEALNARDILVALQKRLEEFTTDEVDEVNDRRPDDFELLLEDLISANVGLEDWAHVDYNYAAFVKEFRKEIGEYKVRGHYEWDEDGIWTNHADFDEIYFGFNDKVYVVLRRDGTMKVNAFYSLKKPVFKKGDYDKVRKYLDKIYLEHGYDGKYNV